jgi:hypothetical protein
MDWLYKAALTATTVALLLSVTQLWGRRAAGLLTGLPTVTAPALMWLALAHGPGLAAEAGRGCIAATSVCAVFASAYAGASRRLGVAQTLAFALLAAAVPGTLLWHWRPDLPALVGFSVVTCLFCAAALPRPGMRPLRTPALGPRPGADVALQAGVSGAISGAVSLIGSEVGTYAAGALSALPTIAAIVVVWLHYGEGNEAVEPFVRGYINGLYGRTAFVLMFSSIVVWQGTAVALAAASALLCAGLALSAACGEATRRRAATTRLQDLADSAESAPTSSDSAMV